MPAFDLQALILSGQSAADVLLRAQQQLARGIAPGEVGAGVTLAELDGAAHWMTQAAVVLEEAGTNSFLIDPLFLASDHVYQGVAAIREEAIEGVDILAEATREAANVALGGTVLIQQNRTLPLWARWVGELGWDRAGVLAAENERNWAAYVTADANAQAEAAYQAGIQHLRAWLVGEGVVVDHVVVDRSLPAPTKEWATGIEAEFRPIRVAMRRYHPDVAGDVSAAVIQARTNVTKRINDTIRDAKVNIERALSEPDPTRAAGYRKAVDDEMAKLRRIATRAREAEGAA